jgi:hypothetical protein
MTPNPMPNRAMRFRFVPHVAVSACVACVAPLVGLAACGQPRSFAGEAQEEFSRTYSCPKERVAVTERTDLKSYDLEVGKPDPPPAEVARDPGRLAEWNKRQQANAEGYKYDHIFFVKGCEHETYYRCTTAQSTNDQQTIMCSVPRYPPGTAKTATSATIDVAPTPTVAPVAPAAPPIAPTKAKK